MGGPWLGRTKMTDDSEKLTVSVVREARRLAKESEAKIECCVCGLPGVANTPDHLIVYSPGKPFALAHYACLAEPRN